MTKALEDLVQITTYNFKPELREENYWLLFAPISVGWEPSQFMNNFEPLFIYFRGSTFDHSTHRLPSTLRG